MLPSKVPGAKTDECSSEAALTYEFMEVPSVARTIRWVSKLPLGQLPEPPAPVGLQTDIDTIARGWCAPLVVVGADVGDGAGAFVGEGSACLVAWRGSSLVAVGAAGVEHAIITPNAMTVMVSRNSTFIIFSLKN
jgi:hypothetical protein